MKNYLKSPKKYLIPLVVFTICSYALYLRLAKLAHHILWNDEYYQLNQMLGSFADLIKSLRYEYCSYLSGGLYLVYPFFRIFFYNKWGLSIPSIIATIIGFYLLYLICKQYFKTLLGFIITFGIICLNVNLINHATEIRTYAILPTLALSVFYALGLLVDPKLNLSRKSKYIIGFVLVMAMWFHVYGIIMVLSLLSFHIFSIRKEEYFSKVLIKISRFMSIVFFIAMPFWIYSVFGQHLDIKQFKVDTFYFIPSPLKDFSGFLKGIFGNLVGFKGFYCALIGILFPFLFPYKGRIKQIGFLIFAVFLPISLIFFLDLKNAYWFVQRQFVWVIPLFAFFLGWSWDSFFIFLVEKMKNGLKNKL